MKRSLVELSLVALVAACQTPTAQPQDPAEASRETRLFAGFGNYQRPVTTASAQAQRWFNQGMQLLYGFNHDEAIRSFEKVAEADPECAMAFWGIAYANGFHINNPTMSDQQVLAAYNAAQEARRLSDGASSAESALIDAVVRRYTWPRQPSRRDLDEDYAAAMGEAWSSHPDDADIGALYAESMMDLQPWDLWTADGQPKGRTEEIIATLEAALAIDPRHPGANHFYIHTVEASPEPEKATAAADRLVDLVPGAGHLVHMPSHIYTRVGRYADAADANVRAIEADKAYFEVAPAPDFYSLYFVHNVHFLAYAAMMEGRYEAAMQAARQLEAEIPENFLRDYVEFADGFMTTAFHVQIRFGKWQDILSVPEPQAFQLLSRAERHYARGVALSALGRTEEARAELEAFEERAALVPRDWTVGNNDSGEVLDLSRQMLLGELLYREGRLEEAFAALRRGAELEDALVYDEPPGWMQPVRHAWGALLMAAARYGEAEQVYRDDLDRNAENGWSLLGLEQALAAQDRMLEAVDVQGRRVSAWSRADVEPTSSCYCEPGSIR